MTIANRAYWIAADPHASSVEGTVSSVLGSYASEYDEDAIAEDIRAAVNDALPEGVVLCGNSFIGEYDVEVDFAGLLESIDIWEIASKHEI